MVLGAARSRSTSPIASASRRRWSAAVAARRGRDVAWLGAGSGKSPPIVSCGRTAYATTAWRRRTLTRATSRIRRPSRGQRAAGRRGAPSDRDVRVDRPRYRTCVRRARAASARSRRGHCRRGRPPRAPDGNRREHHRGPRHGEALTRLPPSWGVARRGGNASPVRARRPGTGSIGCSPLDSSRSSASWPMASAMPRSPAVCSSAKAPSSGTSARSCAHSA